MLLAPTVEVRAISDPAHLMRRSTGLRAIDWLVFTSANGVRFFLERLKDEGRDLRALGHLKLAAIGPSTAQALAAVSPDCRPGARDVTARRLSRRRWPATRGEADSAGPRRSRADRPQG